MIRIGLVTVLYKSDNVLEGFFKSLSAQQFKEYILYLVDNSVSTATDELIARLSRQYPLTTVRRIRNSDNEGVAAGNNTGIRQALADGCSHVLLLNNDIEFRQDYLLHEMVSLCTRNGEVMVVPRIYYYESGRVWMAGGYMDLWRALGVHYGYNKPDGPEYEKACYISYAPTCFMLIAREVFDKTGFMDERYFAYYDDTDFVLRATRLGFRLYYAPGLKVLHKVSSSTGGDSPFYVYYSSRNKIYFIRKNLQGFRRWFALGYTLLSRVAFWLRYNREKKKSLVKGLKDGFRMTIPPAVRAEG